MKSWCYNLFEGISSGRAINFSPNRKKQLTGSKKAVEWSAHQGLSEKD
jgi:hypothetical protein